MIIPQNYPLWLVFTDCYDGEYAEDSFDAGPFRIVGWEYEYENKPLPICEDYGTPDFSARRWETLESLDDARTRARRTEALLQAGANYQDKGETS